MDIGTKIRMIRKSKGITQIDLAENAGIAVNSLRLYEANKRQPRADQLRAIASALGVSVADLLDVKPARAVDPNETEAEREKRLGLPEGYFKRLHTPEEVAEEPDVTFNDFTYALYNESKELSDADKEMLLEMARFFKQRLNEEKNNKQ